MVRPGTPWCALVRRGAPWYAVCSRPMIVLGKDQGQADAPSPVPLFGAHHGGCRGVLDTSNPTHPCPLALLDRLFARASIMRIEPPLHGRLK